MTTPETRSGTGAPAELFFEDLVPGLTVDLGTVTVDGDEMLAFARRFDPQWYHVDSALAGASRHGGVIASGFYTVSLFMRAYVDHLLSRAAADASPGLEELRWLAPVRAGDRLAVRVDVMGARPSTARPGLGTVSLTGTMLRLGPDNRPEQEVMRTRFRGWFALRPAEPTPESSPTETSQPESSPTETSQPGSGPTETSQPGSGPTETTQPGGSPAETDQPEGGTAETSRPGVGAAQAGRAEGVPAPRPDSDPAGTKTPH
ncbi:MaoC/PaaZ C-terminal domain-containing protein [Micromonospora profundi]|uniref:MaoC/PaaZ C-terminal domain-containing protein n=1 Tax=Micromonospora profundi TaxID=1420889 RepID=UPI003829E089